MFEHIVYERKRAWGARDDIDDVSFATFSFRNLLMLGLHAGLLLTLYGAARYGRVRRCHFHGNLPSIDYTHAPSILALSVIAHHISVSARRFAQLSWRIADVPLDPDISSFHFPSFIQLPFDRIT